MMNAMKGCREKKLIISVFIQKQFTAQHIIVIIESKMNILNEQCFKKHKMHADIPIAGSLLNYTNATIWINKEEKNGRKNEEF